jgi:hypothetical protein
MDRSKPQVIDGVLWPPNTIEVQDILTVGRIFNYDSPQHGMLRLVVQKTDGEYCHCMGTHTKLIYKDRWIDYDIGKIYL